jgi:desumoylating isopeptidase 1
MEKLYMGRTELPHEVIEDYLGSLSEIYTPEVLNGCPS